MMTLKNWIITSLLLSALALTSWSILLSRKPLPAFLLNTIQLPDAFMETVSTTVMNKDGNVALKIEAPRVTHYSENDSNLIFKPHITVFRQSPKPWYIDAEKAKTKNGTNEVTFLKNVVIFHPGDSMDPTTTMKTDSLTIFPDKHIAQTADAVNIIQANTVVNAVGMFANLHDGTVKLLAQAKGEYGPTS